MLYSLKLVESVISSFVGRILKSSALLWMFSINLSLYQEH